MFCTGLVAGWSNCYVGVIALDVDMIFLLIFGLCVAVVHLNSFYQCYINHLLACLTFILTFCPYLFASLLTCIPLRVGTFHFHDGRWSKATSGHFRFCAYFVF